MSVREKLERMRGHLGITNAQDPGASQDTHDREASHETHQAQVPGTSQEAQNREAQEAQATLVPRPNGRFPQLDQDRAEETPSLAHKEIWTKLGASVLREGEEYILVREVVYPLTHQHGRYALGDLSDVLGAWAASGVTHPLSGASLAPEDLLFFDTETTGLHGGTGNAIFLLGHSRFEGDSVRVRQHFLATPMAEGLFYRTFLQESHTATHLVTYNGKSFDWPQVRTRHTLLRHDLPPLPSFAHLDLLHGARRLWREDLESCRLSLIEPEKLAVFRRDDVPGHLAPILYFEFLQTLDPFVMTGVLRHNELDVLSLITLYIHLSRLLIGRRRGLATEQENLAIARWFAALGLLEQAEAHYRIVAQSGGDLILPALMGLGAVLKRVQQYESCANVWEQCLLLVSHDSSALRFELEVELSKIYEHRLHDLERAFVHALSAGEVSARAGLRQGCTQAAREATVRRIDRLKRRISGLS